uniref:SLC26A/SulP transporter domain-containing protein n=1 Tax=Megaselia scalaris TaxID=36166 RepID=T1GU96_MEGSC
MSQILRKKLMTCCSVSSIKNWFPCIDFVINYQKEFLLYDVIAGFTVALQTIPQSIAIALVAGLPANYGLNSAYISDLVYFLLGPSKDCVISPTTILAVMLSYYVSGYGESIAVLVTCLSGIVILCMGFLRLGFLVQFVSAPVVYGFVSAAALAISSIQEIKRLKSIPPTVANYICLSRNATIMCLGILIAFCFTGDDYTGPFALAKPISPHFPNFTFPSFQFEHDDHQYGFIDILRILGFSLLTIPLVAVLEHTAIVKSFGRFQFL